MNKKTIAVIMTVLLLTVFTGCKSGNANSTEQTPAAAQNTADTPSTPDKPVKVLTPYDFPYDTEKIRADLIEYGEGLGLYYDDNVTMKNANSITNNQTKAAGSGAVLEKWCKKDLDSIEKIAKYQNVPSDEVGFNIIIYDSPDYDGEYIIGIYAELD